MKKLTITIEFTMQDNDCIWAVENAPKYRDRIPNAYYLSKLQDEANEVKLSLKSHSTYDNAHTCTICHNNWVDSDNGYDTCSDCLRSF